MSLSFLLGLPRLWARVAVFAALPAAVLAQSVSWTGPALTGTALTDFNNSSWSVAGNWSSGAIPTTVNDVFISGGNLSATNTDTFHLGGNRTFSSLTFDNTGGTLPAAMRLAGSNATTAQTRVLTLSNNATAGGTVLSAINGANVTLFAYPTSPTTGNSTSAFSVALGYNGTANVVVDASSRLQITRFTQTGVFNGGYTKTGAGTLVIQGSSGNLTGNTTLSEGTIQLMASSQSATSGAFGTGTLVLAGGTLSSNSTAARVIQSSALALNGTATLGHATNNGTLTFNSTASAALWQDSTLNVASAVTISSNLTGAHALTKSGTGTLTLSGSANSYSGGTSITAGTLAGHIGTGSLAVASGATYDLNGASRAIGGLSGSGSVALGASTLTTSSATNSTFAGAITGSGGLTKAGAGVLTLSGANTYTGATSITAGGLALDGSLASASVSIASGATLSGTGSFAGSVSISGAHLPGNSPGQQSFTNLTYQSGASVTWELAANSVAGAGTNFDQILVSNALDFAGPATFLLSFNPAGSSVMWSDPFWATSHSWQVYSAGTLSNFSNLSLSAADWSDAGGNLFEASRAGAMFSLSAIGNDVFLNYTAVPEPSTYAAIAGLLALGGGWWRRRRLGRPQC